MRGFPNVLQIGAVFREFPKKFEFVSLIPVVLNRFSDYLIGLLVGWTIH